MGDINYMTLGDRELFNVARTSRLARKIGLNTVRIRQELTQVIESRFVGYGFGLGGFGVQPFGGVVSPYDDPTQSPWYSASDPASVEFAGIVPLAMQGLDDSSSEANPTEYVGNGGNTGRLRNATQSLVASVAIVATTDRGAEFGKRYLDRILHQPYLSSTSSCSGADLSYFRYEARGLDKAPMVHRRDVALSRGTSVTRRKLSRCSSTWLATFTLTAGDPFEYSDPQPALTFLGFTNPNAVGPGLVSSGSRLLTEQACPVYSYDPIYDPNYPALVASPTAPNLLPAGWSIEDGMQFNRAWALIQNVKDADFSTVPLFKVSTTVDARMVRLSIWPGSYPTDSLCDPLWSAVISYLPASQDFYIDGEQEASYTWDGVTPYVRRTDSLVYSPQGNPVEWDTFTADNDSLLVTVDTFSSSTAEAQSNTNVKLSLALIARSD